ncbi:MAG: hypothetical protein FJ279_30400, partial [Planctomycetes bacterium]|nr:hypothetical protein [Planctomycetota bacterium]
MKQILACLTVLAALEARCFVRVAAGQAFTFRDDFAGYPSGSDGGPNWASADVDWEVRDGA